MKKNKLPTKRECLLAQCHECSGHYADGRVDCENVKCPLYLYMPYGKLEPDLSWTKYNPRRVGLVTFEESARDELTEEQREKIAERLQKARLKKSK